MYDLFICDDFALRAEVDEYEQILLHCEVSNWSKSVAKRYKAVTKDLKEALYLEGFEKAYTITPNPKFAKLIDGWEHLSDLEYQGEKLEVIVWELD